MASVVAGGPADKAGLREGDQVVSVSGRTVDESSDVAAAIASLEPGGGVKIGVRRGDGERTLSATLGTRPAEG